MVHGEREREREGAARQVEQQVWRLGLGESVVTGEGEGVEVLSPMK